MRKLSTLLIAALAFVALTTEAAQEDSLRAALKEQVFADAKTALRRANEAAASVLTPNTYREAGELYERAEKAFDNGADVDRVRKTINQSTLLFRQAAEMAPTVESFVSAAYQARLDAIEVEAKTRTPEMWLEAEQQLYEATSRAEKGRESRIEKYATEAETLFRNAELASIEQTLFTEIEEELKTARSLDADRWAPQSYQSAVRLLEDARNVLAENRYDTDQPRNLARQALHEVKHAQYVAKLADDIDDKDTNLEQVLLAWEASLQPVGESLDVPMYFDAGPDNAITLIMAAVQELKNRNADLGQRLSVSQRRVRLMQEELVTAQAELEDRAAAKARLDKRLAEQAARERTVTQVESLFNRTEAEVVRAENRLVIRLVGLGFASGSAEVEARHEPVLNKLIEAIRAFPDAPITIEGHTDSYGADASNLRLSIQRADSVAAYVLERTGMPGSRISSVGYGETKPIANNETSDGRLKNRRIDVVLYPSWWTGL